MVVCILYCTSPYIVSTGMQRNFLWTTSFYFRNWGILLCYSFYYLIWFISFICMAFLLMLLLLHLLILSCCLYFYFFNSFFSKIVPFVCKSYSCCFLFCFSIFCFIILQWGILLWGASKYQVQVCNVNVKCVDLVTFLPLFNNLWINFPSWLYLPIEFLFPLSLYLGTHCW